jgi:hypothetical protein
MQFVNLSHEFRKTYDDCAEKFGKVINTDMGFVYIQKICLTGMSYEQMFSAHFIRYKQACPTDKFSDILCSFCFLCNCRYNIARRAFLFVIKYGKRDSYPVGVTC